MNSVFIGPVKPVPQQDPDWHANMTAQDVNTQMQWQGDWDVLERRMGDLIVVLLNSTGRMDPKMDNGQANASSRLPYVFLIESGVADMVAIADAQVDSAKWHNVNMYCKKHEVTAFYGPTSNAVCKIENIVSEQGTSSSTSGGTLLLMTNMVAGHMCQMPRHQTVGKQLHLSFDFVGAHLDIIVLYGVASPSTWQQKSLCSELAIALTRSLHECKGGSLVMANTNSVWRTLDRIGGVKNKYDESADSVCNVLVRLGLQELHVLRHPNRQDFTFWKQGKGISRIDAFRANHNLLQMVDLQSLRTAVATLPGPLCIDHRAIAVKMNLNLHYDRRRGVHNVIAISTVERPRRGKTLLEKQMMMMIAFITFKSSLVPLFEGL